MLNRKTEALVSVKFLDRRAGAVDGATEGEIMNHRKLQSPHIARLKEVFLTDKHLAVVTEHAPGGPLFRHIVHKGRLLEADARRYFRQLLAGIAHCHAQGVYHRDLRLDSLRLDACDDLVLTDFGYSAAKLTASGEMADLRNPAASPAYTPPEVLLGHSIVNANYDGEVLDIWACGIIMYVMLFGGFPFEDSAGPRSTRSIIKRLVRLQYTFPSGASPEAKDLLARIFVASKAKRISLADMLSSPWVTDGGALPPVPSESLQGSPRDLKAPSFDLLSGLGASTPLAASAPSAAFGQAPPETPSAFESLRSPSLGSLFSRRSGRERQQSDTDIRELVRKAMKGT